MVKVVFDWTKKLESLQLKTSVLEIYFISFILIDIYSLECYIRLERYMYKLGYNNIGWLYDSIIKYGYNF